MLRLISWLLLFLLLTSCSSRSESQPKGWIFDLSEFVENIAAEYTGRTAIKKIQINGNIEEKEVKLDLAKELGPLERSDVNILSLMDRYRCDTVFFMTDSVKITHEALDDKLRTRRIEVIKRGNEVSRIYVHNSYKSLISSSEETIEWKSDGKYYLTKTDKSVFRDPTNLNIEVVVR
jgi:hypothetical protein